MTDKQPEALRLAELLESIGVLEAADELRRLHQVDVAHGWWLDKTEWVQESSEGDDLGRHRADVMKQRIDRLRYENEALRAALEQPQVEQRPVANNWSVFNSGAEVASGLSLEDAVDYLNYRDRLGRDWCAVCVIDKGNPPIFVNPQPKREPLTDEQIWELYSDWHGEPDGCYGFARAIEAAHNIK